MKKLAILFFLAALQMHAAAQRSETIREYIETYKEIAMSEMIRSGVPAAITLAQGIHESAAGTSNLVQRSNNHFGIKCKSEWKGEWVSHDDDARGECFRKYSDPYESYRDHSDFLKNRPHYASLFSLDPTDYEGWAHGLKKAGYATNPKYAQILIKTIRDYNLDAYTLLALERQEKGEVIWASQKNTPVNARPQPAGQKQPKKEYPAGVFTINGTKVIHITAGTSYMAIASEHNIPLARLFDFNDLAPADIAEEDQLVYLQRKRKTGKDEVHVVGDGETAYGIAQEQGIRLESLLAYNNITAAAPLRMGEKLYLAGPAPNQPRTGMVQELKDLFAASKEAVRKAEPDNIVYHRVQPKETLYAIARQYGTSVDAIIQENNLGSVEIKTGQELKIVKTKAHGNHQGTR